MTGQNAKPEPLHGKKRCLDCLSGGFDNIFDKDSPICLSCRSTATMPPSHVLTCRPVASGNQASVFKLTRRGLIYGASSRPDGRNVRLRLAMLRELAAFPGGAFADIGGGEGSYALQLLEHCQQLCLIDVEPHVLARARQRLAHATHVVIVEATAEATGLPGQGFDAAFLIEVLDHVDDPQAVMAEAFRLLKPGGWLYLTVPNKAFPMETHPVRLGRAFLPPSCMPFLPWIGWLHTRLATARVFSSARLVRMTEAAGFVDTRIDYLMPPFERHPRLQSLSAWLARTPLRRFGVSLCAVAVKPGAEPGHAG
ncbi:methyltransferase domain-containing protein [Paracidovorax avenae]